jgi:hypothetical protein
VQGVLTSVLAQIRRATRYRLVGWRVAEAPGRFPPPFVGLVSRPGGLQLAACGVGERTRRSGSWTLSSVPRESLPATQTQIGRREEATEAISNDAESGVHLSYTAVPRRHRVVLSPDVRPSCGSLQQADLSGVTGTWSLRDVLWPALTRDCCELKIWLSSRRVRQRRAIVSRR